jgi:hypothetical protein
MMTPLEDYLLSYVFQIEDHPQADRMQFFTESEPGMVISYDPEEDELRRRLAVSRDLSPDLCNEIDKLSTKNTHEIEIDELGGYEVIFQSIIKRNSQELPYISIELSFGYVISRDQMRGGFGDMCILITADSIQRISAYEALESRIRKMRATDAT